MPSMRKKTRRDGRQKTALGRVLLLDALRNWAIPLPLGGGALLLWVVYEAALIGRTRALTFGGALVLLAALYLGLAQTCWTWGSFTASAHPSRRSAAPAPSTGSF